MIEGGEPGHHVPAGVEAGNTFAGAVENHRPQAKERARPRISGIIILPGAPRRAVD